MKSKWAVWILALMLCTSGAFAKSSSSVSSSSSRSGSGFSRGFSAAKPSGTNSTKSDTSDAKKSFGTFSSSKPATTPASSGTSDTASGKSTRTGLFSSTAPAGTATLAAGGKSALSTGLDKNAAQENALKTYDQRTGAKAAATPGTDFGRGSSIQDQRPIGSTGAPPPINSQPTYIPPHPIVVRDSGSSFGSNLLWFMLGRSISEHRHYDAPYSGGMPGQYQNGPQGSDIAVPRESFGWTALRIFLWLALLSAIGWGIWFYMRRKNQQAARRHYTL